MSGDVFGNEDAGIDILVDKTADEAFSLCAAEKIPYNSLQSVDHRAYLKLKVQNEQGLHMRPCSAVLEITQKYEGDVYAKELKKGRIVNAKSIMDTLTLAVSRGTDIAFCFRYTDSYCKKQAEKCAAQLTELFKNKFNE